MKKKPVIPLALVLCLFIAACQNAGNGDNTSDTTANQDETKISAMVTDKEEDFVEDVIEANGEEMSFLKAALTSGTDTALKSHAQQMLNDHEQMDRDMRAYASKKNISLEDIDTTTTTGLNERAGNEWDEEWADEIGDMHAKLIRKFERAQNYVKDNELKDLITTSLPKLRSHRDAAEQLEARLDKNR